MILSTQSIVLRAVKYGETSLISTQLTRLHGVQAYLIQGVRSSSGKGRGNRAGLLQPGMQLDIVAYHKGPGNLDRLKEFGPSYIYQNLHDDIIRNSIALFSVELLLRLLPEGAPVPELFDFSVEYFRQLDQSTGAGIGNYPLFFVLQCSRLLGYELGGCWSEATPWLNLAEGGFTQHAPAVGTPVTSQDAHALALLMHINRFSDLAEVAMNAAMRQRLLEWFLEFLQRHTDHMREMKSLPVLQAILHQ